MNKKMKYMMLPQAVTKADPISVTPEQVLARMRYSYVEQNVNGFRQKLAEGTSPDEEYMKKMKQNLPLLFCAQSIKEQGKGRRNNFTPSFAVGIDLDGIPGDVRQLYNDIIAPRVKELKIGMVQVTIKQHGLHIWADRLPGETTRNAQLRIASALGLQQYLDKQCIDPGRGFFLTTEKDLLYFDPDSFFMTEEEAEQAKYFDEIDNTNKIDNSNKLNNNMMNINTNQSAPVGALAYMPEDKPQQTVQTEYQGARLKDIVDEFIRLAMPNGIHVGDRNTNMYKIFINLQQICSPAAAIQATKHITGIPQSDIDSTLASAARKIDAGEASMNSLFQRAINNCVAEAKLDAGEEELDIDTQSSTPPLHQYPLPRLLQLLTRNIPDYTFTPLLVASLPALGAILTGVTYPYWFDGNTQHLAFLTMVIAEQQSGKSSLIYPRINLLAKILFDEDARAEEQWDLYYDALEHRKNGEPMPQKPTSSTRIAPTDVTAAAFFNTLRQANGKTLLLNDDEGNAFFQTGGGPQYRMTKEIVKKAYDQAIYKTGRRESKFSGPITLNIILYGTAQILQNFSGAGEGDVARYTIATIEKNPLHQPRIKPLEMDDQAEIYQITQNLSQMAGMRYATWIDDAAEKYRDELEDKFLHTASNAIRLTYKRTCVNYTRFAYLLGCLYGCLQSSSFELPKPEDEEKRQACLAWARYLADYTQSQTLRFFSKQFDQCADDIPPQIYCPDLYEPLAEEFTTSALKAICEEKNHYKGNTSPLLRIWIQNGMIEYVKDENGRIMRGQYRKIKKTN